MKRPFNTMLILFALLAFAAPVSAFEPPVAARIVLPYTEFAPGKSYPVLLELVIKEGFHINSAKPLDPALIPTAITFTVSDAAITTGRVTYPEPALRTFRFSPDPLSVYEGTVYVATSVSFAEGAKEPLILTAHLQYQACTDLTCMIPVDIDVTVPLLLGNPTVAMEPELFARFAAIEEEGAFGLLREGVGPMALLMVFFAGLGLTLTPCVYPLIPVTIGYFGAATGRPRSVQLAHALVYMLGMALMYSALGVAAALTGALFGALMQNTMVVVLLSGVMIALAASMFGAFEITVPSFLLNIGGKSYAGYFGTFMMGLTVGIMAAPCVGPFVIGLLTFVGERQDPLLGFLLFFVLALGLGAPFVLLALFSGGLQKLPRSGVWMEWVRKLFGVALVAMALYFARPLIPDAAMYGWLMAAIALAGGIFLLWAGRGIGGAVFGAFRWGIGLALFIAAFMLVPGKQTAEEGITFAAYSKSAVAGSAAKGKPAIIDFTADWCVPCRELKLFTFTDGRVKQAAAGFDAYMVDLTTVEPDETAAKAEWNVLGVPTVIIVGADGKEVDRFTGFIDADGFLKRLEKAKP